MSFMRLSRFLLPLSAVLVTVSVVLLFVPGPNLGIEFTGGTLMEFRLPEGKTKADLETALGAFRDKAGQPLGSTYMATTKTETMFVRTRTIDNENHLALLDHLKKQTGEQLQELQYTTIGPTVGASMKRRALWALVIATVAIVLYIALAFRSVPKSLSPWKFGVLAVAALLHDIIITVGIFTILSHFTTFQVDTLFVTALLSIMGYSVNDTIVIFDRIRDNLSGGQKANISEVADRSLLQTLTRTINTGLGALIMLFALFFLGSESIRWFILTLILGTVIGTYSSFFIATPLLVYWRKR